MPYRVAWVHPHEGYLENRTFDPDLGRDDAHYPWYALRRYLADRDIDLQTYDVFETQGVVPDLYFFLDLFRRSVPFILSRRIKPGRCLLIASETKLSLGGILPMQSFMWQFLRLWPGFFRVVLTYDRKLIDGKRFRRIFYPQPFFLSHRQYWEREKQGFSAMIISNKTSRSPGENYSVRRRLIRFFEKEHPDRFDLYGTGWNEPQTWLERTFPKSMFRTSMYRGTVNSKLDVLANYRFAFCPENHCYPDYITEKIFDALFAGSVPVYLGAPNVGEYLPPEMFVDWQRFSSFDRLYAEMEDIAGSARFIRMREAGWEFLNSESFVPFSVDHFCRVVHQAIVDTLDMEIP